MDLHSKPPFGEFDRSAQTVARQKTERGVEMQAASAERTAGPQPVNPSSNEMALTNTNEH
jgi:hypothetical protein